MIVFLTSDIKWKCCARFRNRTAFIRRWETLLSPCRHPRMISLLKAKNLTEDSVTPLINRLLSDLKRILSLLQHEVSSHTIIGLLKICWGASEEFGFLKDTLVTFSKHDTHT